jgi:hypothetical protein
LNQQRQSDFIEVVGLVIDGVEVGRIAVADILPRPEPALGGNRDSFPGT